MITSRRQNIIQNQNIVIENLSFQILEKFRYLGVTVTNTNDIREEIKRRINIGNACYYSLEKILSSRLLSKKAILYHSKQYSLCRSTAFYDEIPLKQ